MNIEQNVLRNLPADSEARKNIPIATGVMDYFPLALAEVARISKLGNDKHNPGEPLHWARGKSTDHADCIARHLIERGTIGPDGISHSASLAWRALALLQEEMEAKAGWVPKTIQQECIDLVNRKCLVDFDPDPEVDAIAVY